MPLMALRMKYFTYQKYIMTSAIHILIYSYSISKSVPEDLSTIFRLCNISNSKNFDLKMHRYFNATQFYLNCLSKKFWRNVMRGATHGIAHEILYILEVYTFLCFSYFRIQSEYHYPIFRLSNRTDRENLDLKSA